MRLGQLASLCLTSTMSNLGRHFDLTVHFVGVSNIAPHRKAQPEAYGTQCCGAGPFLSGSGFFNNIPPSLLE